MGYQVSGRVRSQTRSVARGQSEREGGYLGGFPSCIRNSLVLAVRLLNPLQVRFESLKREQNKFV